MKPQYEIKTDILETMRRCGLSFRSMAQLTHVHSITIEEKLTGWQRLYPEEREEILRILTNEKTRQQNKEIVLPVQRQQAAAEQQAERL